MPKPGTLRANFEEPGRFLSRLWTEGSISVPMLKDMAVGDGKCGWAVLDGRVSQIAHR